MKRISFLIVLLLGGAYKVHAEPPVASYMFPAGGQRGTVVKLRVGGLFLHTSCSFEMLGPGMAFSKRLSRMPTTWFEGPLLPIPDSQRQEDYPQDMAGEVKIAADAPLGTRYWRLATSQGCTAPLKFVIGDLPEIVEGEIDGDPQPVDVQLPLTINGRIFPRADVDVWRFSATRGQAITCEVNASRLGSPLDTRMELLDSGGKRLGESQSIPGGDSRLRFIAPNDGQYQLRIHDAGFQGSQWHVYRLTMTAGPYVDRVFPLGGKRGAKTGFALFGQNVPDKAAVTLPTGTAGWVWESFAGAGKKSNPILLDLDDVEELTATAGQVRLVPLPAMCNGRIEKPGATSSWQVALKKGETLEAELRATRLGSPLDGVISILAADGKLLARTDQPVPDLDDPVLKFSAPADGTYTVQVEDRFHSRGGPDFAYRLRLRTSPISDFRLHLAAPLVNLPRGGKAELALTAERFGDFKAPINLTVEGLPKYVTAKFTEIGASPGAKITFEADKDSTIQSFPVMIRGTAKVGSGVITRDARVRVPYGQPAIEGMQIAVALPTPFKIKGAYDMRWAARGSMHDRVYQIERNGFDGPLEIRLADRQARHLQGVHAPPITVPAGATEFRYAVHLPPWMETGRTSRTCVMAVGIIKDKDGTEHEVSFSSVGQNEQMVAVVEPGKLDIALERSSVTLNPGKIAEVAFQVARAKGLKGSVTVELILPNHIKGLRGDRVTLKKEETLGRMVVHCAEPLPGPINMPLVLRATLVYDGRPVIAEVKCDAVTAR